MLNNDHTLEQLRGLRLEGMVHALHDQAMSSAATALDFNARLALLSHDGRSFREDMRMAREWLERYFDGRAKPVQAALATVKTLGAANVAVESPTLNETLAALRNFKSSPK